MALAKQQEALLLSPSNSTFRINVAIDEAELAFETGNLRGAIEKIQAAIALGGAGLRERLAYFQEQQARVEARRRAEEARRQEEARREAAAAAAREEEARQEGSGANSRHEQTIVASLCDVQARSTAFQTAGAARP
jgi:hypothetical protein